MLTQLLASLVILAQPGFPPDSPDSWVTAGTAKILCSALFVSGRNKVEAIRNITTYFIGNKRDSVTFTVDSSRKLVRATLANRITREAKRYGDQGCIIHQPGRDSIHFKPVPVTSSLPPAATTDWPMGDRNATAISAGVDTTKLRQAVDAAFGNGNGLTAAFIVVHRGKIIAERYAQGANANMPLESWSMGKSIVGTLIGLLINDGALKLEDPAPVAEWQKTPNDPRAKIRIMDLMRMSSGLRFSRGSPEDLPGYHDHDLPYTGAIDAAQFSITRPLQFEPNTFGRYRNADPLTLGYIVRETVRKRGEEYLTYPQRALFDKLGIRGQMLETDPYGNFLITGYDYGTARNWARLGMLYLNDGVWMGRRLLPEGFVKFVSTPAPAWRTPTYGGMVWVNGDSAWALPRDAFAFKGAGEQDVFIVPSHEMVIVRMGHYPGSRVGAQDVRRAHQLLMEAIPRKGAPSQQQRTVRIPNNSATAFHVLNRLAFGPRTGDIGRVLQFGVGNWIEQQLSADTSLDANAITALDGCPLFTKPLENTLARFNSSESFSMRGQNGAMREVMDGMRPSHSRSMLFREAC